MISVPVSASRVISPTRVLSAQRLMTGAIAGLAAYPIYAMSFDGEKDYVEAPLSPNISSQSNYTVEFMIYMISYDPQTDTFFHFHSSPATWRFQMRQLPETTLRYNVEKDGASYYYDSNRRVELGVWQQIDMVFDSTKVRFYFDGTKTAEHDRVEEDPYTFVGVWLVSESGYAWFVNCYMAFLRIYNRALSDSEIQHNCLNPMSPIIDDLILWLDARKVVNDLWPDLSGYGNDGVIYGAEWIAVEKPSAETEIIIGWNARISGHEYVSTVRPAARVIPCSR